MKPGSVCIIIENSRGEVLLLLRDDIPTIQYPGHWVTLGGQMEPDESPEEALRRELQEEIEFSPETLSLVMTYDWPEKKEWVFHTVAELDLSTTPLHEGQRLSWFSREDALRLRLAFHDKRILEEFFRGRRSDP